MGLGTGALAVIGGTVVIVAFLTVTTGGLVAVIGYNQFADIGVEALTGFASAYFNVRLAAPLTAGIALAATIGAGADRATRRDADQRGNRRAGSHGHPLDRLPCIDAAGGRGDRGDPAVLRGGAGRLLRGTADAPPRSTDSPAVYTTTTSTPSFTRLSLVWSFLLAISMAIVIMLVHTYYGFTATGGPAGVGEAVGRAVRTSLVSAGVLTVFISLAIYGQSGSFNLSG